MKTVWEKQTLKSPKIVWTQADWETLNRDMFEGGAAAENYECDLFEIYGWSDKGMSLAKLWFGNRESAVCGLKIKVLLEFSLVL